MLLRPELPHLVVEPLLLLVDTLLLFDEPLLPLVDTLLLFDERVNPVGERGELFGQLDQLVRQDVPAHCLAELFVSAQQTQQVFRRPYVVSVGHQSIQQPAGCPAVPCVHSIISASQSSQRRVARPERRLESADTVTPVTLQPPAGSRPSARPIPLFANSPA